MIICKAIIPIVYSLFIGGGICCCCKKAFWPFFDAGILCPNDIAVVKWNDI